MSNKAEARKLAEQITDFLRTDLGQHLLKQLSLQYNGLHHQAEGQELTVEQKAMRIERAAGVKWVIDYLMQRKHLLETGHYKEAAEEQQ